MEVATGKVAGRRQLKFDTLAAALTDAESLVAAERNARLTRLGNWSLGQALGHLAAWSDYSYTGAPMKPPFFIRWILRTQKSKFLYSPMRAGLKIPRVAGGTYSIEAMPSDEGLARLRRAFDRLQREAPTTPNVIFGPLTHEQWIALNLRHADLHLSFFAAQ